MAPNAAEVIDYRSLLDPGEKWYKHLSLWQLNAWVVLYLLGNMANGYDGALVNGLQILPQWQTFFDHPTGSQLGLIGAIQNIGSLGSIFLAPLALDYFGRKRTVWGGACLMLIGAAIQVSAQDVNWFLGGRVTLGFGTGFVNAGDLLMVLEITYPPQRAPLAGSYNAMTGIGSIVCAVTTFGSYYIVSTFGWSWRLPALIQIVPSALQFFLVPFSPESPRWLIANGREVEALRILGKYHGKGNEHHPLVLYEFEEMKNAIAAEQAAKKQGWADLFRTSGMRKRMFTDITLAICGQWSGNSMVTYYLNQVLNTIGLTDRPEQLGINIGISVTSFISAVTAGSTCDIFGRRRLFLVSTCGMLIWFTCITIGSAEYTIHHTQASGNSVVAFIFLFTVFYAIGWSSVLALYVTEILPFSLRAKGRSVFNIFQAGFQVFNQYVNPIAFLALGWKYYIVFDCIIVCILIFVYFFVPETKGHTLEETALLFDGEAAVAELSNKAAQQAELDANLQENAIASDTSPKGASTPAAEDDKEKGWVASHHEHKRPSTSQD
ncbi:hexose transporter [Calocera viscosa TUFC12733]|uniref:Hexose transporter n=1 Tax=Calocera viscosa (strain TUFC12733) TaxID=1330018 RepID=A0A167FIT1_CALVF|nr:hexose transporter [Calocera viscosa TUFC12733]